MSKGKIVIALGGNALQRKGDPATAEAQLEVVKQTCLQIAKVVEADYEIALVHGNGPQVGRILLAFEAAKDVTPPMPFDVCGAMSQGYIGYHLQQGMRYAIREKLHKSIPTVSLATQMIVDENDPSFKNPTKPIGPFYTEDEARRLEKEKGWVLKEDAGRGWRRVVASPMPKKILEINTVRRLWESTIVITAGGGGIPVVVRKNGALEGVAAVIDKDFAAALLADDVEADALMILTEVEYASLYYNTPQQQNLGNISVEEAEEYVAAGHFAPGSMLPKIKACIQFARANPGRRSIITSLDKAAEALEGKTGTVITL